MTSDDNRGILEADGLTAVFKTMQVVDKIKSFLKEVYIELRKVNWLSRKDLLRYTMAVIAVTVAVAAFLGGLDYIFNFLLKIFVVFRGY